MVEAVLPCHLRNQILFYTGRSGPVVALMLALCMPNGTGSVVSLPGCPDDLQDIRKGNQSSTRMQASLMCGTVLMFLFMLCDIRPLLGTSVLENTAPNADHLLLQRRDEEPQYPDDVYDSGEQDRWPTLAELERYSSKRQLARKRGQLLSPYAEQVDGNLAGSEVDMAYGKHPLTVKKLASGLTNPEEEKERAMRRQSLENSLYDLLSSPPRSAPDRRTVDNLKDFYVLDLLKRHRMPRSSDSALLDDRQHTSEHLVPDKSSNKLVIG